MAEAEIAKIMFTNLVNRLERLNEDYIQQW